MGPAPSLSTYESAAQSIYAPQEQADITTQQATTAADVANLQSETGQVNTDYQSAIDNLNNSVQDQTGKIGQLYATRLLGNISGLQGNDMGEMYAKADQQQSLIEETRANKLSSISTAETNAQNEGNAAVSALESKYQGEEANYAQSAYSSAVKDYNTTAYQQEELGLEYAKLQNSESNTTTSEENTLASSFKATGKEGVGPNGSSDVASTSNGYDFTGPNGAPISMAQYLNGSTGGNLNSALGQQTLLNLLQNGSSYDKSIYGAVKGLSGSQLLSTVSAIDSKGTKVNGKTIGGANAYGL